MSCSVNLVPAARLLARTRTRRRTAWVGVCTAAGVFLAAGWGLQHTAGGILTRLSVKVNALERQHAEGQRRLVVAAARRTQLLEQLRTIAEARRPQPWAHHLAALTLGAPDGVFLTAIKVTPAGTESSSAGRTQSDDSDSSQAHAIRLLGYALDHSSLIQLLNVLQNLPGWQQVELVRATSEPYEGSSAVAFELACQTREGLQ